MKNIYIVSVVLLFSASILSQNSFKDAQSTFSKEKIFVHTNTNFFLTGEQVLFAIYCLNAKENTPSTLSKIAYVELINNKNESILKQKIRLDNGKGYGDLFLKSSFKTGTYKLIAYTQWMRNQQVFFEETIFIVNPFTDKLTPADSLRKNNFEVSTTAKTNSSFLALDQKTYTKRQEVVLKLGYHNLVNASISVRKLENINLPEKLTAQGFLEGYQTPTENSKKTYLPELRGELFHGKITSKDQNVHHKKIGLSFTGEHKITKISSSNAQGEFYFTVNKNYSANQVKVEVLGDNTEAYTIQLFNNDSLEKKFSGFTPLFLTENLRKLIKERSTYTQLENAYLSVKKSTPEPLKDLAYVFEQNANKVTYKLDDYNRFKTVKEVAVEILKDVWLTKNNNDYSFKLRDANLASSDDLNTLLIVDGTIIDNHTDFMSFDALKINSIVLIQEKYYFGSQLYQGIINITTFDQNYHLESNKVLASSLLKPTLNKAYFHPNYSTTKNKNIPDFRTQLYWNPMAAMTKEIRFFTSDVAGEYQIELQGFTENGKPVVEISNFTVN